MVPPLLSLSFSKLVQRCCWGVIGACSVRTVFFQYGVSLIYLLSIVALVLWDDTAEHEGIGFLL